MEALSYQSNLKLAVNELKRILTSESESLSKRFRSLFSLKHIAIKHSFLPAIDAMAAAFESPSALLKHEVAYCLGQTKNIMAVPYLRTMLINRDEDPMCRHEAAEAMGAIGDVNCLDILKKFRDAEDEVPEVKETCELAVDRITWEHKEAGKEILRSRFVVLEKHNRMLICKIVILNLLILPRQKQKKIL